MSTNSAGAYRKLNSMLNTIIESLESANKDAAQAMLEAAASQAPTLDEEYAELNAEAGQDPEVPRVGGRSADTDGRTRFEKPESTYLKNAIVDPQNKVSSATLISVGNRDFLEQAAHFKYTNYSKKRGLQEYTVGSYFNMFESGAAAVTLLNIVPHEQGYPLRPGEGPDGTASSVTKSITGRWMFSPTAMKLAAQAVLSAALALIGPGREGP